MVSWGRVILGALTSPPLQSTHRGGGRALQ